MICGFQMTGDQCFGAQKNVGVVAQLVSNISYIFGVSAWTLKVHYKVISIPYQRDSHETESCSSVSDFRGS